MVDTMTSLEISELRYRRLFEGARDGILILDLTTLQIVDANPYIEELLEYEHGELLGKELWEIGLIRDQAESQRLYQLLQEHGFVRYEDLPLLSKGGKQREVEFISNVYQEGDRRVIQCNIRDISQRKLNEAQRERLVQTEKLRLLGEMARGVAHDLNQSLGLISGYSDLALADVTTFGTEGDTLRDMLGVIAQAATDGGQIVARLLTFARGQPDGPAEDVPLAALLTRVGQLTAPRWRDTPRVEGRPITLTVESEPDMVVRGWPATLREALVNLIFNAVDALPEGGTIRIRAYRCGQEIAVEVRDSGVGMSAEVQTQVFHPLFTTKGVNGSGIGLAQVSSTVEQHSGKITIESSPGQGTTFRLLFPAVHAAAEERSILKVGGTLRILVVDDEPALADILAKLLRLDDHTVEVVHEGAAALERLSITTFDLVISDMGMPNMNGWELARQVRAHHPKVLIIIASVWGSQISLEEAHEVGIQAVVSKPYRRADLQKVISSLVMT